MCRRAQNRTSPIPKKSRKKPTIVVDMMSTDCWFVIAEYLAILRPLKIAAKRPEGYPSEGKFRVI